MTRHRLLAGSFPTRLSGFLLFLALSAAPAVATIHYSVSRLTPSSICFA